MRGEAPYPHTSLSSLHESTQYIVGRCNGTAECLHGEDETGCTGCQEHQFQCVESRRCIMLEWRCDGTKDCEDNSDEDPAICSKGVEKPLIPGTTCLSSA